LPPEIEAELKIIGFIPFDLETRFVGKQQVVKLIGYSIIEKRWNPEKLLLPVSFTEIALYQIGWGKITEPVS
jgi:hypothetical protein